MRNSIFLIAASALIIISEISTAAPKNFIGREGEIAMTELASPGFSELPPERKLFVYNLSQAMRVSRDIFWHQASREGLAIRNLLSEMWAQADAAAEVFPKEDKILLSQYFFRILIEHRNYDKFTNAKFVPKISISSFENLIEFTASKLGSKGNAFLKEYARLKDDIFSPEQRPNLLAGLPQDRVLNSNSNFYANGLKEDDLKGLTLSPLSHLSMVDGQIFEEAPRIGGLFGRYLEAADGYLAKASAYATPLEKEFIQALRNAYREGTPEAWHVAFEAWLKNQPKDIDFMLGFIEVYEDPMGERRAWEGWIMLLARDEETESRVQAIRSNAVKFEAAMPTEKRFQKTGEFVPPQAEGNDLLYASGRTGDQPFLGKNLFSDADLKEKYGSKSFTNLNMMADLNSTESRETLFASYIQEYHFFLMNVDLNLMRRLSVEFHEILGHGSGKKLPGITDANLKEAYSPTEEARAEVAYLFHILRNETFTYSILPKMTRYERNAFQIIALVSFFTNHIDGLSRLKEGTTTFRQAHQWARQALLNDLIDQGCLEVIEGDLPRLRHSSLDHCRESLGDIWKRVQFWVSTGDYDGAMEWLNTKGVLRENQIDWPQKINAYIDSQNRSKYQVTMNPKIELAEEVVLKSRTESSYSVFDFINEYVSENKKIAEEIDCQSFLTN